MDSEQFFSVNSPFMSSPLKSAALRSKKRTQPRPFKSKKSKISTHTINSVFNRSFLQPAKEINRKIDNQADNTSLNQNNQAFNTLSESRKTKTLNSFSENARKQTIYNRHQTSPIRARKLMISSKQQTISDPLQQFTNATLGQSRAKSLTFDYYYRNIMEIHTKEKIQFPEEDKEEQQKSPNLKFTRHFTTNLNQQMLQSMKKYIRKGLRVLQVGSKFIGEPILHYGLEIKGIQPKKPFNEDQPVPKGFKKYSAGSLLVVKKQNSETKILPENKSFNRTLKNSKQASLQESIIYKKCLPKCQTAKTKAKHYRKKDERTVFTRLQGMLTNLNLILNSFKCVHIRQPVQKSQKQVQKYSYFIGYGNNKNLIRSIMQKRWWWVQTQEMSEACFVWTQLKVNLVLGVMESQTIRLQCKSSTNQSKNIGEIMFDLDKSTLDSLNRAQISIKRNPSTRQGSSQLLQQLLGSENKQKLHKIFHKQTSQQSILLFDKHFKQIPQDLTEIHTPKVVHNHYKLNYMFGNKNALFHNLKMYFKFTKNENQLYSVIPKTYYLQKVNKTQIREFYQKEFTSNQAQKNKTENNIWIVKPAENSNRGQGISVHKSFQTIRKEICSTKNSGKFIVQKYLRNLFLYQNRKFDIRTYLLMVTIGKTTKYFWYNEGYLRTSSEVYNLSDIENIFVHLTNDAIQCDGEKYGKYQPGNKLSYSQFQRYLDCTYPQQKYQMDNLNLKMKKIATKAVKAIHPKIMTEKVNYSFELFGLDFLIDRNFCPWLVEINTNPCLQLGCPVLDRLIPRMLQNMFRLCLDPVFQPSQEVSKASSYFIYDNFFDINRFQLIFDSHYDQDPEWLSYCRKTEEKVYADDNQVFQNDGKEMDVEI